MMSASGCFLNVLVFAAAAVVLVVVFAVVFAAVVATGAATGAAFFAAVVLLGFLVAISFYSFTP